MIRSLSESSAFDIENDRVYRLEKRVGLLEDWRRSTIKPVVINNGLKKRVCLPTLISFLFVFTFPVALVFLLIGCLGVYNDCNEKVVADITSFVAYDNSTCGMNAMFTLKDTMYNVTLLQSKCPYQRNVLLCYPHGKPNKAKTYNKNTYEDYKTSYQLMIAGSVLLPFGFVFWIIILLNR